MLRRRSFIKNSFFSIIGFSVLRTDSLSILKQAFDDLNFNQSPNEEFWLTVRSAFNIDDKLINLNSGGISPTPISVHNRFKEYLDKSNLLPAYYNWHVFEPQKELVRKKIAENFGVDSEEIAITRNASEALQIVQQGLELKNKDEVIITDHEYFRMKNTWEQLERRRGVKIIQIQLPVPFVDDDYLITEIKKRISSRTKILHISHVVYLTGQILPIKQISQLAHENDIKLICDGAQSFALLPFTHKDIESDFFGTSLHKWCYAPNGTGFLHIRKELLTKVWPLMAAPKSMDNNIRKFEEIGTHPAANHNAIVDAIEFNSQIGIERKLNRIKTLNNVWINRISGYPEFNLLTNTKDSSKWCGMVLFNISGVNSSKLYKYLLEEEKILTSPMVHNNFKGIRISPNIFNSLSEMEKLSEILESVIKGKVDQVKL